MKRKKVLSLCLSVLIVFETGILPVARAVSGLAAYTSSASYSDLMTIGQTTLQQVQEVTENGDGTYTLRLSLRSNISSSAQNENPQQSQNGYFTVTHSGDYLIELWGGTGADGQDSSYSSGGKGAPGGHIYGVLYLEAGQTLYYALGGNGTQTTVSDSGGGANGSGGTHGEVGSYSIGGGGGYSAVYLFDSAEFEQKYLDTAGEMSASLDEADRVSKYLMIAGGGGGGGAGNGLSLIGSATGTPDGGAGGSVGGNAGVISGEGYSVSGTFFAGENGKSSGTSTAYTGRGGSNLPGTVSSTVTTLFDVEVPNDWLGTYNSASEGGAGGAGNMRGGSGGAGFCGGSGGIMTGILLPTNVGGGGGGSSFLAESVQYDNLSEQAQSKLQYVNPSVTGGAVNITYLGEHPAQQQKLFSFSGQTSQYFVIEQAFASQGAVTFTEDTFAVTDSRLDLLDGQDYSSVEVTLVLRPKQGFAGGNGVPLLEQGSIACTSGEDTIHILLNDACRAVNVPLDFTALARSYVTNISGQTYLVSQLYTDQYASVRDMLSAYWQYDFIAAISPYTVTDSSGAILQSSDTIQATRTASYQVAFTVTPKDGTPAPVGEQVAEQMFSAQATITLFAANSGQLNSSRISYTKSLSHDLETDIYKLALQVKAGTDQNYSNINPYRSPYSPDHANATVSVPASGYYLFQVWGGNGGDGNGASGGAGGEGGYLYGIMHMDAGDIITAQVGADGSTPSAGRAGGTGGGSTQVQWNDSLLLVAGGGGGGGGYGTLFGWVSGDDGESVSQTLTEPAADSSAYTGGDGENGTLFVGGTGGSAGVNYRSSAVSLDAGGLSEQAQAVVEAASSADYDRSAAGGALYITPIQLDRTTDTVEEEIESALSGYALDVDISQYFTVNDVTVLNRDGTACEAAVQTDAQHISITGIMPAVEKVQSIEDTGVITVSGAADFTVTVHLSVRDGFLGGNDVPVLSYENAQNNTGMKLSQQESSISIPRQGDNNPNNPNKSDFANVPIRYTVDLDQLTAHEVTYVRGDPAILHINLFTYSGAAQEYTWEDDHVVFMTPHNIVTEYTPLATTQIPIEVGIAPSVLTPEKASVGLVAVQDVQSKNATIHVRYQVIYNMENLQTSDTPDDEAGRYLILPGQDYSASLIAEKGALLPEQIEISVGGRVLSHEEYSYNHGTGEILIPAQQVTDSIVISAHTQAAVSYTVHYVYETQPGGDPQVQEASYTAGAPLYADFTQEYVPPEFAGYQFRWDWGTDAGLSVMPQRDVWVFGTYEPVSYSLTITYVDPEGNQIAESYTGQLTYGSEFRVESPLVAGYMPDQPIAQGTITADTSIQVVYTPTHNQLNIVYILNDSKTLHSTVSQQYDTDAAYTVESPVLEGYTADQPVVSGVMPPEGVTVYVYYTPNSYTVTLDPQGGTCTVTQKTVVYNNIYGYDGVSYGALPTPIRVGYTFAGWYAGDTLVTEQTVVTTAGDHVLTARWERAAFQLVIRYLYEDHLPAGEEYRATVVCGDAYSVPSPAIPGYMADPQTVDGVMPAQNIVVTVTYRKDSYRLTVQYVYPDQTQVFPDCVQDIPRGSPYSVLSQPALGHTPDREEVSGESLTQDTTVVVTYYPNHYQLIIHYQLEDGTPAHADYTQTVTYGDGYSVKSPEYEDHTPSIPVVSGTMGATDEEITVIYYEQEVPEVISVDIEWGNLTFRAGYDDWDPETHQYRTASVEAHTAGANYIKVTNRSTVPVSAQMSASISQEYAQFFQEYFTMTGSPSDDALQEPGIPLGTSADDNTGTVWLWLDEAGSGALASSGLDGEMTVGSCTVTISKEAGE